MALNFHDKYANVITSPRLGKAPPVTGGLQVFNLDGETAGINQWIKGAGSEIIGEPEQVSRFSTHYSVFNSILTSLPDSPEATFISVLRVWASGNGTNSTIAGIYPNTGQTARGFGIGMLSSGSLFASASSYDGTEAGATSNILATLPAIDNIPTTWDSGVWRCVAGKVWIEDNRVNVKIMDLSTGVSAQKTSVENYVRDMRNGDARISIGQGRGGGQDMKGDKEMAATMIYNAALSDDMIMKTYVSLKGYFSKRGINF